MDQTLLSDRVNRMSYSATFVMSNKARELKAQGHDVITLSLGEPDFDPPQFVKQAAIDAINGAYHKYTPVPGYLELRQAIANKFKRDNQLTYAPDQILVSTGGKQSIINVFLALLNEGDEVIIPAPYWVSYIEMVKLADGTPVVLPTDISTEFKITPEQLEKAITPKTKAFIFSSPSNPTGMVYTKEELAELAKVFAKHPNLIIISDEIYEYINYAGGHTSIASFPEVYEQTVTLNGLSKAFAMTGWRLGYIGGPKWLVAACDKIQGQMTSGANSIAQRAAIAALEADPKEISFMIEEFKKRKEIMTQSLSEVPGFKVIEPQGAFYLFPEVSDWFGKTVKGKEINSAQDLAMLILEEAHVATVTGEAFGADDCLRISYAASQEQIETAVKRIKDLLSE